MSDDGVRSSRVPNRNRVIVPCLLGATVWAIGCGAPDSGPAAESDAGAGDSVLQVHVVNYPLQYFARRIGGDDVEVAFPAPPDVDPAFWEPGPEVVAAYQASDLILLSGAGYARWVQRAALPPSRVVDTSRGFRDRLIVREDATVHSHGPGGEHSHGDVAFTVWLDPTLAVEQAAAIRDGLIVARPEREAAFRERYGELERELMEVDHRLEEITARASDRAVLGSHPVYQYLARRYGLDLRSVHFEPDEEPDADAWGELERLLVEHPADRMLWEGVPLEATAARLHELGIDSVVFDPCGNVPAKGDFLTVMRANVDNLTAALDR